MVRLAIGSWVVDEATDTIERGSERLKLERRTMATLIHLAERPNAVVPREELLDAIWPNVIVSDHSVATVISDLRRALGDQSKEPKYIETIAKRGYRLIAPVKVLEADAIAADNPPARRFSVRAIAAAAAVLLVSLLVFFVMPNRNGQAAVGGTIVVHDFENASGQPDLDHIPFALSDIISSTLAEASSAPVVRAPSGASDQGGSVASAAVSVSGRVLRDGDDIVALVQATETKTRELIWSDSYVVAPGRLASRSREMARDVSAALGLSAPEMLQSANVGPGAYERYWRARFLWDRRDMESIRGARKILEDLTRDNPRFAAAHTALADIYAHKSGEELGIPRVDTFREAQLLLDRSNALAPGTSDSFVTQAVISFYRDRNLAASRRAVERAIDRNSDNPRAWQTLAMVESGAGNRAASIAAIERAGRMDPGSGSIAWDHAWHLYLAQRYGEAMAATQKARRFGQSGSLLTALIYGGAGREEEAFKAWLQRAAEAGVDRRELARISTAPQPLRYRLLGEAFRRSANPPRPVIVALLLLKGGDKEAAARALAAESGTRRDWMMIWVPHMRDFAALRPQGQRAS